MYKTPESFHQPQEQIHLVTGGDENYLPGIQVVVGSALAGLPANRSVCFHVLDGGISFGSKKQIEVLCLRMHPKCTLIFHTIENEELAWLEPGPGNSKMCYARLWMERLLPDLGCIIYLDSDVLVIGDLSQVWDLSKGKNIVMMACRDRKIINLSEDSPLQLANSERDLPYFNSGFFLTNLTIWRELGILNAVYEIANKQKYQCKWHDQTLLNYLFRGQFSILPQEWNWQWDDIPSTPENALKIIHYTTGLKPWGYWGVSFRFQAWRACYRSCVGSPMRLFLTNGSWRGLINGLFDGLLDSSQLVRFLYLSHLKLSLKLSGKNERTVLIEQKIDFLASPRKSRNHSREKQLLKELQDRLSTRVG